MYSSLPIPSRSWIAPDCQGLKCVTDLHSGVIPNSSSPESPWLIKVQNIAKGEAFLSSGYGSALDSACFLHELQARGLFILTLPHPSPNHYHGIFPMQKLTGWVQSMTHGKKGSDRCPSPHEGTFSSPPILQGAQAGDF